jgi:sugar/nucleoside kinase (ribokinase family)
MNNNQPSSLDVISFGTVYIDVDFLNFPFVEGIFAHRETVGDRYSLEVGGSAFNFTKICANLDLKVLFVGKIGKDPIGSVLKQIASAGKVTTKFIEVGAASTQTNLAAHYVHEDGTSIMTSAGSANQSLSPQDLESAIENHLPNAKYLYLGGGLKLHALLPGYPKLVAQAKKAGVKVVLDHGRVTNLVTEDHKRIIKSIIGDVDIYLPSRDEFLDLWSFSDLEAGLKSLENKVGGTIIIKDSINGCYSIKSGEVVRVSPPSVIPVNTIGAGDSFNAGYITADLLGIKSLEEKMQFASTTAGIKISQNKLPSRGDVESLVKGNY